MASILQQLEAELPAARGSASRRGSRADSVFTLANEIDTRALLARYNIEHDEKHAHCPGCGEPGALLCDGGGLKCLHNRCAHVGPPNHPGFRSNVDLVAEREQVPPPRAAEILCEWFNVPRPSKLPLGESPPAEWNAPIPLGDQLATNQFPIEAQPEPLRAWVEAEAEATQTPPDLAAVVALATISACVAKKVEVEIRPRWSEPLNTYWVVALEPGNRKSAVFRDAVAPLHQCEKALREQLVASAKAGEIRQRILERRVNAAIAEAARSGSPRDCQTAEELAVEMESMRVQSPPCLVVDDITPERLAGMLAEQGDALPS